MPVLGKIWDQDRALADWLFELDVDWVLQLHQLQDNSASWLQGSVVRWIRALMVTAYSIQEMVSTIRRTLAVAQFVKASISKMLVFIDALVSVPRVGNLGSVLDMYISVSNASYMFTPVVISPEAQIIFNETGGLLQREGNRLLETISNTMEEVRALIEDDDSWAIEIPRGGGGVHRKTQLMVDYIMSMWDAWNQISAPSHSAVNLRGLIENTVDYLKDLLLRKSELCSDPSLRYLFLLNNSHFITQVYGDHGGLERVKYMDNYLDVSWGPVLSCIPKSNFNGPFHCLINTSPLAKFQSAFHKTYHAQKFWKVPDPQLRDALRRTIAARVISGYHDCLKEHPELAELVSHRSSCPEVFEQMLGELFEG
ncbi:exocyst complex component EXO70B1-like [Triticum urartu]|nr:exocyst complex component EXO70B1-like [Triticum urartu]XP_048553626.1 exocyst complex component EXO70B1-like [Triticum urartu]